MSESLTAWQNDVDGTIAINQISRGNEPTFKTTYSASLRTHDEEEEDLFVNAVITVEKEKGAINFSSASRSFVSLTRL